MLMNFNDSKFIHIHHRNVWGEWTFIFEGIKLCGLQYRGESLPSGIKACAYAQTNAEERVRGRTAQVYQKAIQELNLYLSGKLKKFTIPIKIYGTEFQVKVLEETQRIPYGKTKTYKQIADTIEHPHSERAVGNALHQNPLQVVIPCHRVINSNKAIGGYALGADLKRRLLCMEGSIPNELELE